jgi:hypothetical protein
MTKNERAAVEERAVIVEYEDSWPRPTHSAFGYSPPAPEVVMLSDINRAMETGHMAA